MTVQYLSTISDQERFQANLFWPVNSCLVLSQDCAVAQLLFPPWLLQMVLVLRLV